ncbi:4-carboxy-4-hydroxy-2-oxoadipate aldolase/oxaloacetate decarboxylase [Gordonia bronchialis]|uniref:4-carboxy-4-hydroxy-2-oxoadipate aldolase/oxaloacetate decarboxylase n=1 Tax=Gordonia bronchialis TaxID=2054 RepID=UPI00226FB163|nr:4-carboxy-4-hydroxy-2-oxoadipate aldolase/oxaloacetate decarboxylase [Gordonia bronchialis]
MKDPVIVTDIARTPAEAVETLSKYGTATVHEAMGRIGLPGPQFRPIQDGARIAGNAVTVLSWPGDNLMIHAAIEQVQPGDVLVVTTNSPSSDGMFGELFATALQARGVHALVTEAGVRDVADLRDMGFAVWSTAVSAQGTVKATAGAVNIPITLGNVTVHPGDVVVADDDGVVVVPRADVDAVLEASAARLDKEEKSREAFRAGQLGLDRYDLRPLLDSLGVRYVKQSDYLEGR